MEQVEAPRIRPGVRGSFDEETCRMRLDRLGREHVPRYPFEHGIQQIYAILLGEYGRSQIADVISVLHELLEDESIEGYIWRSWRHEWRHRNDDILNPFVPAVGDFVLPPPTSKGIRALKAANFSATEGQVLPSSRSSVIDHDEELPSYISSQSLAQFPAQFCDHERTFDAGSVVNHEIVQETRQDENQQSKSDSQQHMRPSNEEDPNDQPVRNENDILSSKTNEDDEDLSQQSPLKSDEVGQPSDQGNSGVQAEQVGHSLDEDDDNGPDKDSQQEFASVTNSDGHHDDPNLLNFEMLDMRPGLLSQHRRTQSEPTDTLVLRPVHSGAPSSDIGRDVEMPYRRWSEYLEPGNEHEAEPGGRPANSTPRAQQADASLDEDEPATCSAVLHMPFASPMSDAEFNEELLDKSETHPAPSAGQQEKTDDDIQQLLPDAAYIDQAVPLPLSMVRSYTAEKTTASIDTASDHASLHSWRGDKSDSIEANQREISVINGEVVSHALQQSVSPTPGRFPIDSPGEEEISQIRSHKCELNDHRDGVRCSRISAERYPIDGHESSHGNHRTSMLLSRKETQPSQLLRRGRSLLHHLPKLFRKGRESKQTNHQDPDSIEGSSSTIAGLFRRRSTKTGLRSKIGIGSRPKPGPNRTTPIFSFDGACDEDDTMSTIPAVDLNKALPPQPLLTKSETPATCGTNTPSLAHSYESKTQPSTASTLSSDLSRVSSKKRFHRTTHDLVHPEMAGSRAPSPLHELDADKLLVASKYDPLASPKEPGTPMTFSSFNNANPFMDQYDEFIPPMPVLAIPELRSPDPVKSSRAYGIPQSRSDGQIYSPKPLQVEYTGSKYQVGQSDGTDERCTTTSRGRIPSRDVPQPTATLPSVDEKSAARGAESRKRSRSPVKRFLGLGKSQSMKDIPQDKEANDESDKKAGLKLWGDRLRHGFLVSISLPTIQRILMDFWTNTEPKANTNTPQPEVGRSRAPSQSTFPISIPPTRQAKIQAEVELMICVTANKFLKYQQKAGLMSRESVAKIVSQWKQKNRPQVLEFQFDQATQRDLVLYNINSFKFYGEAQTSPMVLNATMYAWKVLAKEMSVRTFCAPDSVIRKHLHDSHKVLEMLGAGLPTFLALQELQVGALKEMAEKQKVKVERRRQREKEKEAGGSGTMAGSGTGSAKTRKFTPPTPTASSFTWTPMGAFVDEETLFESQFET